MEAEGAVVSFLLDSWGAETPGVAVFSEVVAVLGVVVVPVSVVGAADGVTVLVWVVVSLAGVGVLLLHPEKARGRAANKPAIANLTVTSMDDVFIIFTVNGF